MVGLVSRHKQQEHRAISEFNQPCSPEGHYLLRKVGLNERNTVQMKRPSSRKPVKTHSAKQFCAGDNESSCVRNLNLSTTNPQLEVLLLIF